MKPEFLRASSLISLLLGFSILLTPLIVLGQETKIVPPKNKYSPADDVKLGRQAAAQAERQLPILHNDEVREYVARVGNRLAQAIPPEFQHPEFHYTFEVVDVSDINAFALPGGPMFVNRGMIEAARTEGEMAGVMAHEMSHVALRHGTAQQTKAQKFQYGQIAGAILGGVVGGGLGSLVYQGSEMGLGAYFLRFSREYEKQADILGSHIMARAGYDPRDLAKMFQLIEQKGSGGGAPQWLSDHPNPGNRYEYIMREAQCLTVSNQANDQTDFHRIQALLHELPKARSSQDIAMRGGRNPQNGRGNYPRDDNGGASVQYPSTSYRTYNEADTFQVSVPDNWNEVRSNGTFIFAPQGGYGQAQGQFVFTNGIELGVQRTGSRDLQQATNDLISGLGQGNPNLSQESSYVSTSISGHNALSATLSDTSQVTGRRELITVYTAMLRNGSLFYMLGVAPENQNRVYQSVFRNVVSSIQLNDQR